MASNLTRFDVSGLNKAVQTLLSGYTRRTPALAANTAAYVVAKLAWSKMPYVEPAKIDSELALEVVARTGVRGKPLSMRNANNRSYRVAGNPPVGSGGDPHPSVPLAWLIISARARRGSKYNISTSHHWMIGGGKHPLKGYKVSEFAKIISDRLTRMVKARHSSTKFLQSCWIPAIRTLEPFADKSAVRGRGAGVGPARTGGKKSINDAGWADPAKLGDLVAISTAANAAGLRGYGEALNRKHNEALWRYGAPALQRAIDDEAENIMRHVAEQEMLKAKKSLAGHGVV